MALLLRSWYCFVYAHAGDDTYSAGSSRMAEVALCCATALEHRNFSPVSQEDSSGTHAGGMREEEHMSAPVRCVAEESYGMHTVKASRSKKVRF